jgi:site-specific DNA-methyltransferase (adenine-specific)
MKTLPDKSIDLFVCDLPYGCLSANPNNKRKRFVNGVDTGTMLEGQTIGGCAWDIPINLTEFWIQVERLMKDDHVPIIHFCNTRFGYELIQSKEDWFRYDLVWEKTRKVGFLLANKMPMRSHENIYVFAKKGARYNRVDIEGDFPAYVGSHSAASVYNLPKPDLEGYKKVDNGKRCVSSVVRVKGETNKGRHPTQKPNELYQWLIERYSKEGDTILDPTAGSFTSVFTAHKLKRNAIGIEKDDGFYQKALTNECVTTSQTSVHSSSGECSANDRQQSDIVHSD